MLLSCWMALGVMGDGELGSCLDWVLWFCCCLGSVLILRECRVGVLNSTCLA